ncbi:MAG: hypothetical protein V4675_24175 [Verrucomicrobiota bacterium]
MISPRFLWPLCCGWASLALPGLAAAQAIGSFVIPAQRSAEGTRFSYWDRFALPGGTTASYFFDHFPNLLNLGDDADPPNPSNWNTNARLQQIRTPQCFVTSSGALYSFSAATGFEVRYTHAGPGPVVGAVFQIRHAGAAPDASSVRLRYQPAGGGAPVLLAPDFRALDDPGTAGFAEQVMRGYEWDLTGLGVADYVIQFTSVSASMAFYQAQLDTAPGLTFQQALGHLLSTKPAPGLRFGSAGRVEVEALEKRFFTAGQEVPLSASASTGFNHVGWIRPDGTLMDSNGGLTVTFATPKTTDLAVAAIFSPASWQTFRTHWFNHANSLTGTADDFLNDAISGPAADPDGDGASNFTEYAFGGNPGLPDATRLAPQAVILTASENRFAGLTYRRRAGEGDLSYRVEISSDLASWQSGTEAAPVAEQIDGPLESDGTRTVTARLLSPPGNSPVFLRIKALPKTP